MDKINIKIEQWSKSLAERISELNFYNLNEMKTVLSVHIKSALYDCLKEQIPETERKLNQLKIRLMGGGSQEDIKAEIITMKQKRKEEYEVFSILQRENMGKEMTLWMRQHHNDSLESFYKYYNSKYPNPS